MARCQYIRMIRRLSSVTALVRMRSIHFVVNGLPAVSLGPDDPIWTYNGDIWEVDLIASHYTQHVLSLKTGWNLISFNVAPLDGEVLTILHNIIGAFERVLTFDCDEGGLSFYPLAAGIHEQLADHGPVAWLLDRGEPERHIGRSWRAYAGRGAD